VVFEEWSASQSQQSERAVKKRVDIEAEIQRAMNSPNRDTYIALGREIMQQMAADPNNPRFADIRSLLTDVLQSWDCEGKTLH